MWGCGDKYDPDLNEILFRSVEKLMRFFSVPGTNKNERRFYLFTNKQAIYIIKKKVNKNNDDNYVIFENV